MKRTRILTNFDIDSHKPVSVKASDWAEHATIETLNNHFPGSCLTSINRLIHTIIFSRFSPSPFAFLMILPPDNQGENIPLLITGGPDQQEQIQDFLIGGSKIHRGTICEFYLIIYSFYFPLFLRKFPMKMKSFWFKANPLNPLPIRRIYLMVQHAGGGGPVLR